MDRRDTIKTLLIGAVAGTAIGTVGCKVDNNDNNDISVKPGLPVYGRTPDEVEHDRRVSEATFLK